MTGELCRVSLRDRLVAAGLEILDEHGIEELTLRRVAARAGVSHAAPAHHFGSLAGLQDAIAIRGFVRLRDNLLLIEESLPGDIPPYERLSRINQGYLDFSTAQSGLFRMMFSRARHVDPALQQAASETWAVLERATAAFIPPDAQETVRTAIWAMTHGYAVLGLNEPRPNAPQTAAPFDDLLRLLLRPEDA
ncbi:TetR/AcrR family transcriptional regulator [Paracoccus zeaxanthinifaciens]|uniref:TetR/AcrR family transcriptional regulator n=1 Tax=Paracoccus zeaxanthinifaciens TaxID=187400 RepID=UPI0003B598C3|nr:TetR/AcrR family transcriptional regulator [Paracoccus zeaxanthinifaciens]